MKHITILGIALAWLACPLLVRADAALTAPAHGKIKVAVVLTDGATMIDFAGPWEVFQDTWVPTRGDSMAAQMPFELLTVGAATKPTRISGGMMVVPDYTFADAPPADIVVVGAQRGAPELTDWLKQAHARGAVVMSVCTGAFKLAATGLLDGRPATTHHDFFDRFASKFPKVRLMHSRRYVQSGDRLFTAGGLSSGIDLALHVVALYFGTETAERTAAYMEYEGTDWRTGTATASR